MHRLEWRDTCDTHHSDFRRSAVLPLGLLQRSYTSVSMTAVDIEIQTNRVGSRPTYVSLLRVFP
jgi:hypothetical protein